MSRGGWNSLVKCRPQRSISRPCVRASTRLGTGELYHPGPFPGFVGDQFAEVGSRAAQDRAAQFSDARLDLGIGQYGVELFVESVDDFGRCIAGRADALPAARLVAW